MIDADCLPATGCWGHTDQGTDATEATKPVGIALSAPWLKHSSLTSGVLVPKAAGDAPREFEWTPDANFASYLAFLDEIVEWCQPEREMLLQKFPGSLWNVREIGRNAVDVVRELQAQWRC